MDQFKLLYDRFKKGSDWINLEYRRLGWTYKHRNFNLRLEKDIEEFQESVVKPMEEAWSQLSWKEKEAFKI